MTPSHLVVDQARLADLGDFDTPADSLDQARALAEQMARETGQPCHVLAVVATVRPGLTLSWDGPA